MHKFKDQELKSKWLAALRSGEYQQASGALCQSSKNGYRYCCLGVLGSISGLSPSDMLGGSYLSSNIVSDSFLDKTIGNRYTYSGDDPETQCYLANLNDNGKTFAEIADFIEENL